MSKLSTDAPTELPTWVHDPPASKEYTLFRVAFLRYMKYRGLSVKDVKLDMELIRGVTPFIGLESLRWQAVNP